MSLKLYKSKKLDSVCYDIRGPVLEEAKRLEESGHRILKLNIGNPAPFGFDAPEEIIQDVITNIMNAQGYVDSKGLFSARKAVMQDFQSRGMRSIQIEDIFMGNGVSELIVMAMQGLLNNGDEILVPAPDYPLWTAAVTLAGGKAVHYVCDEAADWQPDIADIESKINDKTKGIVIINPNNPTGAVYSREILESIYKLAASKNLILFADEIYDRILYEDAKHIPMASLGDEAFCISFNGLSKSYRAAGFRVGWMVLSGKKHHAQDYIAGLQMLANMRLCANVPGQYAVQTALGGYQSINDLVLPGGRLKEQRDLCYDMLTAIPGISCVKPKGSLYLFPKIDIKKFNISSDEKMVFDLLVEKRILLVHGTGFNWHTPDHFRIVFLPDKDTITEAMTELQHFFSGYSQ